MPDPNVREVGRITDMDECELAVGVDYDTVTISPPSKYAPGWRLTAAQAEEFAQLFVSACWQAARQVPGD